MYGCADSSCNLVISVRGYMSSILPLCTAFSWQVAVLPPLLVVLLLAEDIFWPQLLNYRVHFGQKHCLSSLKRNRNEKEGRLKAVNAARLLLSRAPQSSATPAEDLS